MKLITLSYRSLSIGDIITSWFWLSIERKRTPVSASFFSIGPTYNSTLTGLAIGFHRLVILAHIRGRIKENQS